MKRFGKKITVIVLIMLISINAIFPCLSVAAVAQSEEEFREVVANWLENKMTELQTDAKKSEFLDYLLEHWKEEIKNVIDYSNLSEAACGEIVYELLAEQKQKLPYALPAELTETVAKDELFTRLIQLKTIQEQNMQGLDKDTINLRLQEYFQDLISKHKTGTGDFYEYTVMLANRIVPQSKKEAFLNDVPNYINQFMKENLGDALALEDNVFGAFAVTMDSIAGVIAMGGRILFMVVPGAIIQMVETLLGSIGTEENLPFLTIEDIIFNKLALVDVNIFDFETAGNSNISEGNVLYTLRKNVASWYYTIRNIAIVLGLAVLIYTGIRMALSSIADDKAKYKKMFKDWLVSFALIFVLQYLMVFVIELNEGIVGVLADTKTAEEAKFELYGEQTADETTTDGNLQHRLLIDALLPHPMTKGMTITVMYLLLVAMTFLYLIVYIKRLVTISFLIIISPLITITYAVDKAGDGKAQALNKWVKEFVFTILIQPFHCIIYMLFIQNIYYNITQVNILHFGKIFVTIMMFGFMYKADDIVRGIFGFEAKNLSSAAAVGAMALSKAGKVNKLKTNMSNVKGVKGKAEAIKGVKTPDTLPSKAKEAAGNNNKSVAANSSGTNTPSSQSKLKQAGKAVGRAAWDTAKWMNVGKMPRKLANKAMLAALGYGLTGDYMGAEAGMSAGKAIGKVKDELTLSSRVKEKQDGMLDAVANYQESHGLSDEDMMKKERELLNVEDINDIDDVQDRNLAGWLQANRETSRIMGKEDPDKDVMGQLKDYHNS